MFEDRAERLIEPAARLLAERGVYGVAWLDHDLVISALVGRMVEFMAVGKPVIRFMPPLIGLEDDIRALEGTDEVINIPAVSIVTSLDHNPRLNLLLLWSAPDSSFLLVVSRAQTKADLESELSVHIRARLMAEAELRAKSEELSRANRDLEEYASVISHDLKSPLRAMRFLTDDLETAFGRGQDPHALLARLKEQSQRMSDMLSALLDYSSIGRKDEAVTSVDTLALITTILRSTPHPVGIRLELHGEWPVIETLAAPLDLVLRNLVTNAILHHDRDRGVVRVIAVNGNNELEITVQDDGPGIPAEHHAAIFLPFRTVKKNTPGGGQGMGLSFIKRTIESVKGGIDLESDPARQRGTSFRLTWPKIIRA